MIMLDTDVLVDFERGLPESVEWLSTLSESCICGFAAMELLNGCQNRSDRVRVDKVLAGFSVVWPSSADMERALRQFRRLKLSHGLGLVDSLIAATAVGYDYDLATFNQRHFAAVPGLKLLQPYPRQA